MKHRIKPFKGYLCPICVVKFAYYEKLSEHWKRFHGRCLDKRFRSSPPVCYAANKGQFEDYWSNQQYCNRKQLDFKISHDFKTYILGRYDPRLCQFCNHIVWKYAKCCDDCGYTCHVECQHLVASHCKYNMKDEKKAQTLNDIHKRSSFTRSMPNGTMNCELDLTYINDRLIAISFPSFGLEDVYSKGIMEVMKMLKSKHIGNYKIINVSERRYDIHQQTKNGQILNFGWPDHLAPPLQTLHQIIKALHVWLLADLKNVAVLHCKGGKSRIGMVIASYIQFSKNTPNPQRALEWFALRHYYDTKLEGAAQPSQKRYIHYFGKSFEKKLKVTNKRLYFQNIVMHGIPYYGNGTGMCFYLKIYQSYHLRHITKTYWIPPNSERFSVTIDGRVSLEGDIMVKCLHQRDSSQHLVFRLQFCTDAVEGCVAAFGKYDLDEAYKDNRFPDTCFIEFVFSPVDEGDDEGIGEDITTAIAITTSDENNNVYSDSYNIDHKEEDKGDEMMQLPNKGILDMERQMRGIVEADGGGLIHVPGPVDGNPYAQIDHSLKDKYRGKPTVIDTSYNLSRGIEDLEDLLVDLGSPTSYSTSKESKLYNKNNKINASVSSRNFTNAVSDSKVTSTMNGQMAEERYVSYASPIQEKQIINTEYMNLYSNHNRDDEVYAEEVLSPTVNDLLFVLDKPTTPRTINYSKTNMNTQMSRYDNMDDSLYGSDADCPGGPERNNSMDGVMEIQSGTVAKHVKNLQKILNTSDNRTGPKHGIPLAGLVSPQIFHNKMQDHNHHSPTYTNGPSSFKQNQHIHKKVEIDVSHQYCEDKSSLYYPKAEGLQRVGSGDYAEIPNDDDHHDYAKRNTLLSRSDSAYGESMRSSSSSPLMTPSSPRTDNSYIHTDEHEISAIKDNRSGESCSPKSDGLNEISSGIASRSSSMTSLDSSSGDNKHTIIDVKSSTWKSTPISKEVNGFCKADTVDGATQTSPTELSPTLVIESEIRSQTLNENRVLNGRSSEMKMPISVVTTNNNCSTPRGILKTVDVVDRKHLDGDDVFMKNNVPLTFSTSETPCTPRFVEMSTTSLGSSPSDDCGVHLVDQPSYNPRKLSIGSSTGSEGPHSPRSTGSTGGSTGRQTMRRIRSRGGSTGSNSSVSSAELFHEFSRNTSVKFDKETMYLWYKPKITREEATSMLREKDPGTFVVRDSQSFEGAFGLAVKVETPPTNVLQQAGGDLTKIDLDNELVRHFLIEPCKKGVRLKGSSNESPFPSLMALVYQHSLTKMSLPIELVIPSPDPLENDPRATLTDAQKLEKGACCNLVYLGGVDVESLTGDGAIHYAMNKVTSQNIQAKSTTINIKVSHKGITLTDNQRRMFFRRHYIMKNVIHCGIDPKGRKINLKTLVENCDREVECFGFVVKKETNSLITAAGNECHICAEMDPNQPASCVINFIHQAMRYSKV